jgi:hypothetical protein
MTGSELETLDAETRRFLQKAHEAAHAVWGYITAAERGIPIEEAVLGIVTSKSARAGHVKVAGVPAVAWVEAPDIISLSSQSLRAELVVCLAGPWVAATFSNNDPRDELTSNPHNLGDLQYALQLIRTVYPGDPWTEIEAAFTRLWREFPDAADAIIAIAEAIPNIGRLDGSECYRLFRAAMACRGCL